MVTSSNPYIAEPNGCTDYGYTLGTTSPAYKLGDARSIHMSPQNSSVKENDALRGALSDHTSIH